MAQLPFPLVFKRQLPIPLEADSTFATLAELEAYRSSALRYAGQIATCQEAEGVLYIMSNDLSRWIAVAGTGSREGGSAVPIETQEYLVAENTSVVAVDELSITEALIVEGNLAVI